MSRKFLSWLLFLACAGLPLAVEAREPLVQHGPDGSLTSVRHLLAEARDPDCGKAVRQTLTIADLEYDPANKVRVNGIVVKFKDGSRGSINLDSSVYDRLARSDQANLGGLLKVGARRVFEIYMCGASGGFWEADSVAVK